MDIICKSVLLQILNRIWFVVNFNIKIFILQYKCFVLECSGPKYRHFVKVHIKKVRNMIKGSIMPSKRSYCQNKNKYLVLAYECRGLLFLDSEKKMR